MEKLYALYEYLSNNANSEQQAVLDALTTINGLEQGLIDFYGYYYDGSYNNSIEDIMEDLDL